jgi:hypothetical protein
MSFRLSDQPIDPDALKAHLAAAKSISIRESAREVIELKLPKP